MQIDRPDTRSAEARERPCRADGDGVPKIGGQTAGLEEELARDASRLSADLDRFELETLLAGEHDSSNAIVEINAGAGGTRRHATG